MNELINELMNEWINERIPYMYAYTAPLSPCCLGLNRNKPCRIALTQHTVILYIKLCFLLVSA